MSASPRGTVLSILSASLLLGACAAYDPGPPTEILVDETTIGLSDEEVATVYWDHGIYRIDHRREPAITRDSVFLFRYARLIPGEHHFFTYTYHHKTNYEYNWIYGDLEAGRSYKVERSESSGFLGGTTLWVIRDLTTGGVIAESVDCHDHCYILDILHTMHVQDTETAPIPLEGNIMIRLPADFGDNYLGAEEDRQHSLDTVTTQMSVALAESGLPIVSDSHESKELILSISDFALVFESFGGSADFEAYGLSGEYQIVISGEAVLSTSKGVEIDRWRVAAVGESPRAGFFDFGDHETSLRATENAAARFSDILVYDLRRRFLSIPRQSVLSH